MMRDDRDDMHLSTSVSIVVIGGVCLLAGLLMFGLLLAFGLLFEALAGLFK